MYSFAGNICEIYNDVGDHHLRYLLDWASNEDQFAIRQCFSSMIEAGFLEQAFALLFDEKYLTRKTECFEWQSVQDELDYAAQYYLSQQNMYKYLYTTLVSRLPALLGNDHTRTIGEKYAQFLQLDTPPALRKELGLQRILQSIFPVRSDEMSQKELAKQKAGLQEESDLSATTYHFIEYAVGDWRCSCGQLSGSQHWYVVCSACKTPCDLTILEDIRKGTIDILQHHIPLYLTIADDNNQHYTFHLLNIPLMFFITQQTKNICFGLPAYFLLTSKSEERLAIAGIPVNCTYDRQTDFLLILECIFSRTVRRRGKSVKYGMSKIIERALHRPREVPKIVAALSSGFLFRLQKVLEGKYEEHAGIAQFSSLNSFRTGTMLSDTYPDNAIWFDKKVLASPTRFSDLIDIHILSVPIRETQRLDTDAGEHITHLDAFGIVKPGSLINYNDVLVARIGLPKEPGPDGPGPEEKLLAAIFGGRYYSNADLEEDPERWPVAATARVVFCKLYIRKNKSDSFYEDCRKLLISGYPSQEIKENTFFQPKDWARIVLFVQVRIQPAIGDFIYTAQDKRLIIAGYLDEIRANVELPDTIECFYFDKNNSKGLPALPAAAPVKQQLFSRNVRDAIVYASRSRARGEYNLMSQQPVRYHDLRDAQVLSVAIIMRLYELGMHYLLYELQIYRSDGVNSRKRFNDILLDTGCFSIATTLPLPEEQQQLISVVPRQIVNIISYLLAWRVQVVLSDAHPLHLRFNILQDEAVKRLTFGAVTKPLTINYKTFRPEPDGLFCEKIFGSVKHYECLCGKFKREKYKGVVCDRCGVEVIPKTHRAYRMGVIHLVLPVFTCHFIPRTIVSLSSYLGCTAESIQDVIEFNKFVSRVTHEEGADTIVLCSSEEVDEKIQYGSAPYGTPGGGTGAEGILLICTYLKEKGITDLIIEQVLHAITSYVMVIPPDMRPLIPLDDGRFASSDLNDLYRRIIIRNNRITRQVEIKAPAVILRNEYLLLQENVDALYGGKPINYEDRQLKTLKDMIFKEQKKHLLRKSYDYSALTRLLVNPLLTIDQCELPLPIATKIFRPILAHHLLKTRTVDSAASANEWLDAGKMPSALAGSLLHNKPILFFAHINNRTYFYCLLCNIANVEAFRVSPALFDLTTWKLLGTNVKLLPVFAHESVKEVLNSLPSNSLKEKNASNAKKIFKHQEDDPLILSFSNQEELMSKIDRQCYLTKLDKIVMGLPFH